jgi:Ca2+-binding RTX toxin-like protein
VDLLVHPRKEESLRKPTILILLAATLMLTLGAVQAMAQGIPIIFCAQQDPETPRCVGTDQTESLVGQDTRDVNRAFAGDDIINAERGSDEAFGGPGVDNINGKQGNDELSGGRGLDTVSDGVMENGQLSTGDTDVLRGNRGNDIFDARDDDFLDTINCGPGRRDTAFFDVSQNTDQSDAVADNCEFLNEIPGS